MKMSDDDLLRVLRQQADEAYKYDEEVLHPARDRAVSDYMRRPYGNRRTVTRYSSGSEQGKRVTRAFG